MDPVRRSRAMFGKKRTGGGSSWRRDRFFGTISLKHPSQCKLVNKPRFKRQFWWRKVDLALIGWNLEVFCQSQSRKKDFALIGRNLKIFCQSQSRKEDFALIGWNLDHFSQSESTFFHLDGLMNRGKGSGTTPMRSCVRVCEKKSLHVFYAFLTAKNVFIIDFYFWYPLLL